MQSHSNKKQQFVTATPAAGRYHANKTYPYYHQTQPGGDVGAFSGGPGGAAGASLRLSQYPQPHPPPTATPQPPQGPPQLRTQQAPPHNPHNATAAPPVPHSQHHTHTHATLTQHSQHHQVLQSGGVGGHGAGGVGTGVSQVGVPPGPSPAPPGPPHELGTQPLPPGSTPQIQQGSGGSLPVASAHNMMYPSTTQNQPQGPQGNAQGTYFPHPAGPNAPPHQPRPVTLTHSQPMPNFSVMPPNMVHFYPSTGSGNLIYHMPNEKHAATFQHMINQVFQPVAPRQPTPHTPPGQYHPTAIAPGHPPAPYQPLHYQPSQGGKHEAPSTIQYRQPHGVYYPPASQQPQLKPTMNQAPQREKKALAIVDPNTGKNILDDINNEKPDKTPTPPQSSESSARNTPAPSGTPPTKTESAAIAAKFAEEVAKKAAEKDIDIETSEQVVRTNKQSDSSSSTVIVSDSRESKEKLNNSIGNKTESVNTSLVDNAIGKVVPDTVEAISAQAKQQQQQQDSQQQVPLQQFPQQVPQLQPPHLSQQVPQQSLQQSIQLSQSLQQLPQPNVQLSQPTVQPLPQPSVQQLPQSAVQQLSQPTVQQLPQPAVQQLSQPTVQQLPQSAVHQLPQPPPQQMQQLPQQGTQVVPQLPQQLSQQAPQQPPPKQKSPVPQHPQQTQSQQKQQQQQQQQQQPPPQPAQQSQQSIQPLPQPPTEAASPQPPSQPQQQQPQSQQTQKHLESSPKTDPPTKPQVSAPPEVREPQGSVKPEPQLPVKQPNPKPTVVPTPVPKEKEPTAELQPAQSRRGKGPREEPAQSQDIVDDGAAQPQQPQLPAQPQKTPPPPVQQPQPISKFTVQVQNTKEKEKKEKTPEPPAQAKSQPPPPQKASPSPPPLKEPAPPAVPPATTNDETESDREPKEKEVNSVECEVNNVHEEKEEGDDDEEGDEQEKKEDGPQLKYSYKEDQWSPVNPDGKRQYDRRFLLELQNNPLSLKKPESLPNLEVVRDGPGRPKSFDPRGSMAHVGSGPDFTPDYVKSSLGNKQPRMVGRGSQRGRDAGGPVPRGGGGRSGPGKVIIIPHSTGREPKLKTAENAWKPSAKDNGKASDDDQVMKVMRGILNKLTPEKFGKLVDTVKTMPINTTERLSAVIDLIFEKAVDEQSFSSTYAQMCQVLSLMSVRGNGNESNSGKQEVKFRNLIINKCQKEFEKDNTDDFRTERLKEIEACTDPEKKQELELKLVYDETKMRKRSVGNIRFIGELYKLRMLTSPIMMRIIGTLLERGDEESLECLCKLLTTIGKILETQCAQQPKAMSELDKYFKVMEKIVQERQTVTRVRFLMMDVIDLRQNGWVPRREDNKPKTKAQVQEEVKREEFEQQMALASNTGRRDDRDRDRDRRRLRDNRGPQMSDEGWSTVASTKGRAFDSSRLKTFSRPGVTEVTLRSNFGDWGRGSSGGGLKDHNESKQQESNRFNVLVDSMGGNSLAGDSRRNTPSMGGNRLAPGSGPARQGGFGSKSMPPLNDKESAISAVKKFVAPDRSKSTSRPESRDNSIPREPEPLRGYAQVDVEALEKVAIAIVDEYTHNSDPEEAKLCVKEKFVPNTMKYFVQFSLEWVLDRDSKKRKMVGQLYHDLIVEKLLTVEQLLEGSQEILGMVEDFLIDIPQVCEYLGEIFAPCLNDNAVSIHRLLDLAQFAGSKKAHIFAFILSRAAMIMSPNKVSDLWNSSGLSWSSLLPPSANIEDFLAKHQVEFTVDRNKTGNHSGWNPQKVEAEFLKLFKRASNDEIFGWIDANIGNDVKSSKFIRALVTALVESQAATSNDGSSIRVSEDFEEKMKNRLAVVLKYVDGNETLEMQCIYALQALCVKHQYPQGLLEKCFNAFYDSEVVSEEAFEEWVNSKDPEEQEGKGVCITSVQSFIRWLKEADEEG